MEEGLEEGDSSISFDGNIKTLSDLDGGKLSLLSVVLQDSVMQSLDSLYISVQLWV